MSFLRPFESYRRFRELYMCFNCLYLSLNININSSHSKTLISFLLHNIFIVRKNVWTPSLELLEFSSFSPQYHLVFLGFKKLPLEFIVPIAKGYAWTQEYFIFADFHPESKFQTFEVVPLTLTIWSLYVIPCISMRLWCFDDVWIVFQWKPIIFPKTHRNYSMCIMF